MEKIVGKIISIFLLLLSNYIFASDSAIILRMQDMNHKPINQAMCKAPFILQVELKNLDGYTDIHLMQYITGIENFKSSRSMTSHNVSINNGKKIVKAFYDFALRSDKKGTFTVGPFSLQDKNGNIIRSNRLIIPVADQVILSDEIQADKYFITMDVNKKQAYVGEKITLNVKFYDRLFVDDLHLQFPEFHNLYILKNKKNLKKYMMTLGGEDYSVTEWTFDMYGTEPGAVMIQDIHAAFFAPELESKFKFGGAFDFFRSLHKTEHSIVVQPAQVDILPLPEHKDYRDVIAVGQFSKFTISIDQNVAAAGQGIVLTIDLFGDANFEIMQFDSLVLPENFKYYDSNMVVINENRNHKSSKYIVQAHIPGTYHIEPLVLVYFDPIDREYKTLQSNGLDLTITPSVQVLNSSQSALDELIEANDDQGPTLQDFHIIEQGTIHACIPMMIPLSRYQQLLWFLLCIGFLFALYKSALVNVFLKHPMVTNFIIFSQAYRSYNHAVKKKEIYKLHGIFTHLFMQLVGSNRGQFHDVLIIEYLKNKNFSVEQIQKWKFFYERILRASFSLPVQKIDVDLFEQSLEWIKILKEKA